MAARYILTALSVVFLSAALVRLGSGQRLSHPQTRTWLTVGLIFATVSAWLFWKA